MMRITPLELPEMVARIELLGSRVPPGDPSPPTRQCDEVT